MSGQDEILEKSKAGAGWWTGFTLGTFFNHQRTYPTNVLFYVHKIPQAKNTTCGYNDLSPWTAMPTTYPSAAKIPKA
ncbi:hypothetical protein SUNI508_01783 [Seiridium unicorne]|uniref:Uncharacterized protein n=1 Tax=Seiridium unicorne TaxID=138068 RepID=A0ABR2UPY1_9PEZI